MKLYIMRHGQTNYNLKYLLNEIPTKKVYLTKLGKEQAKEAHEYLKEIKFDKIFISTLYRTLQTAEIVAPNQKYFVDERIKDIVSMCDGKSVHYFRSLLKDRYNDKLEGGESFQDVKKRVKLFLDELKKQKLKNVLIISHYDTIRAMMVYFKNLSDEEAFQVRVKNCQIIEIEI